MSARSWRTWGYDRVQPMTPSLRIAAPKPSQVGDVRAPQSAGDQGNTFDASLAAALKTRSVTGDAGAANERGKVSADGDAPSAPAPRKATTGTASADGTSEAPATAPDGSSDTSASVAAPAAPFTLLNALVAACAPAQAADGVATEAVGEPIAATGALVAAVPATALAATATAAATVTAGDAAAAVGGGVSPSAVPTLPGGPQLGAVPGSSVPADAGPDGLAIPLGTQPSTPAMASAVAGESAVMAAPGPVDAVVASLATTAAAPASTSPTGGAAAEDAATAPTVATQTAAPIVGGSPSGGTTPDLSSGGQPAAQAPAPRPGDVAAPVATVTEGAVSVVPDGETVATTNVASGQVVDEPTAVAYGVPGTDALKRAGALADAVEGTSVDSAATGVSRGDGGVLLTGLTTPDDGPARQAPVPAAPRDVSAALPTVAAPAPTPAQATTPVATATPTQQSNLPGSVPLPHQQVATAVGPLLRRADGSYSVNINLEPEHLGRVSLQVHIRAGEVAVTMQAADASAREMLRDNLNQLRQQLEQQGIKAGQLDVRDDPGFARQFQSPQGHGRSADSGVSGQRPMAAGSDEPTSQDSSLQESTAGQPDDTGALDLQM